MGGLIVKVATAAIGVALSPVPVVAVLIILLTKRARSSSFVFATAWIVGNAIAITIGILFANKVHKPAFQQDLPIEAVVTVLVGIGLIVMAWTSRRGRQHSANPEAPPRWINAVDNLSPFGGALVALSNATTSPKNLALALATGLTIRNATPRPAEQAAAGLVYVVVASVTVVTPVVMYFVAGDRATPVLAKWKQYVTANAAVGMELVLFVLGLALAAKGVYNLLS